MTDPAPSAAEALMRLALAEALAAELAGEVPVGALVLSPSGEILSRGRNQVLRTSDPTAHAEIVALREAGHALGNYRLLGCTMVCTLEPCAMCAGAILHARLARLLYAARDPKAGACGSVLSVLNHPALNHRVEVTEGILAEECGALLTSFFRSRRSTTSSSAELKHASHLLTEALGAMAAKKITSAAKKTGAKKTAAKKSSSKSTTPPSRRWSADVETDSTKPAPGLFKKSGKAIAEGLAKKSVSPEGPGQAVRMLNFYENRGGRNLPAERKSALETAKRILHTEVEAKTAAKSAVKKAAVKRPAKKAAKKKVSK